MHNYAAMSGDLYCILHYQQLPQQKENSDEGIGYKRHTDLWLQKTETQPVGKRSDQTAACKDTKQETRLSEVKDLVQQRSTSTSASAQKLELPIEPAKKFISSKPLRFSWPPSKEDDALENKMHTKPEKNIKVIPEFEKSMSVSPRNLRKFYEEKSHSEKDIVNKKIFPSQSFKTSDKQLASPVSSTENNKLELSTATLTRSPGKTTLDTAVESKKSINVLAKVASFQGGETTHINRIPENNKEQIVHSASTKLTKLISVFSESPALSSEVYSKAGTGNKKSLSSDTYQKRIDDLGSCRVDMEAMELNTQEALITESTNTYINEDLTTPVAIKLTEYLSGLTEDTDKAKLDLPPEPDLPAYKDEADHGNAEKSMDTSDIVLKTEGNADGYKYQKSNAENLSDDLGHMINEPTLNGHVKDTSIKVTTEHIKEGPFEQSSEMSNLAMNLNEVKTELDHSLVNEVECQAPSVEQGNEEIPVSSNSKKKNDSKSHIRKESWSKSTGPGKNALSKLLSSIGKDNSDKNGQVNIQKTESKSKSPLSKLFLSSPEKGKEEKKKEAESVISQETSSKEDQEKQQSSKIDEKSGQSDASKACPDQLVDENDVKNIQSTHNSEITNSQPAMEVNIIQNATSESASYECSEKIENEKMNSPVSDQINIMSDFNDLQEMAGSTVSITSNPFGSPKLFSSEEECDDSSKPTEIVLSNSVEEQSVSISGLIKNIPDAGQSQAKNGTESSDNGSTQAGLEVSASEMDPTKIITQNNDQNFDNPSMAPSQKSTSTDNYGISNAPSNPFDSHPLSKGYQPLESEGNPFDVSKPFSAVADDTFDIFNTTPQGSSPETKAEIFSENITDLNLLADHSVPSIQDDIFAVEDFLGTTGFRTENETQATVMNCDDIFSLDPSTESKPASLDPSGMIFSGDLFGSESLISEIPQQPNLENDFDHLFPPISSEPNDSMMIPKPNIDNQWFDDLLG
ncbi:LIMA1 protein, partial [Polypterus senegalus]